MNTHTPSDDPVPVPRRQFLAASAAAALVTTTAISDRVSFAEETRTDRETRLHVKPRYHRWHVDPGMEWVEKNTGHAHLDWTIPLRQTALVLVDVWDRHYLKDTEARAEAIIKEKFVPLLAGCRAAGMPIIHAPSPPQAMRHPNWVNASQERGRAEKPADWPPPAFRSKTGEFAAYRRPSEPREPELVQLRAGLTIHPQVVPVDGEPVIATGEELHEVCKQAGILFLFFAGFNTNACILVRDYGTLAMSQRGYEVLLLRDCTTGMESCQSQPTLGQTHGAILFLEMFGQYSVTSTELLAGLSKP